MPELGFALTSTSGLQAVDIYSDPWAVVISPEVVFRAHGSTEYPFTWSILKNGSGVGAWMTPLGNPNIPLQYNMNTSYVLRVDWLDSSEFRLSVLDGNGSVLGSSTESFTGAPSKLYIDLAGWGVNGSFDNVTVGTLPVVPLPAGIWQGFLGLSLLGGGAIFRHRTSSRSAQQ